MIINNGERRQLVIDGVFDGSAGFHRGVLAFVPNRTKRAAELARDGVLDGEPVSLTIERDGLGPVYLARVTPAG